MSVSRESLALLEGSVVGAYRLGRVQAAWGFYLVYAAENTRTGEVVLAQELVPEELCVRGADGGLVGRDAAAQEKLEWARAQYQAEGRALVALAAPGVRKVSEIVEANGTIYWITPPDEACTLKRWLAELERAPTEAELRRMLDPLLAALARVHAANLLHLNLKPETIQLTPEGQPVLTHFANARQAIARRGHDAGAATDGYSPPEQYDPDRGEDARSDLYALAAISYRAIAGQPPPAAPQRLADDKLGRLSERFRGRYSARWLAALDTALALDPAARPPSLAVWQRMLGPSVAPLRLRVAGAVAAVVLGVGLWFVFRPDPKPVNPQVEDATAEKKEPEQTRDDKKTEEQKQAEEQKLADEKKKAEEEQKEKKEKMAEAREKAEAEQKAAREKKLAAEKAEEERHAKEEAMKQAKTAEAALKKATEEAEAKKLAAEMAAKKVAEEKKAAEEAAAKLAAEMAAKKAAEKKKAAEEAAAKLAAEMAAKKTAEEKKAAEEAAAKKRQEEMAAQSRATPTPPPTQSAVYYSSLPIAGDWVPLESAPDSARKLVIRGRQFTLTGSTGATGFVRLDGGKIYVTPEGAQKSEQGGCKMRALDRIVIEGTSLAGEWRRILKTAQPPPP